MSRDRKERLQRLRFERDELQDKANAIGREIAKLDLEERKEAHPCPCVRLNRDIEIFDMQEQSRRGRNPLSAGGFVADCLTARKDCQTCNGTGVPGKVPGQYED